MTILSRLSPQIVIQKVLWLLATRKYGGRKSLNCDLKNVRCLAHNELWCPPAAKVSIWLTKCRLHVDIIKGYIVISLAAPQHNRGLVNAPGWWWRRRWRMPVGHCKHNPKFISEVTRSPRCYWRELCSPSQKVHLKCITSFNLQNIYLKITE